MCAAGAVVAAGLFSCRRGLLVLDNSFHVTCAVNASYGSRL